MLIQRDLFENIKPFLDSPEAIVITGMRRVGKTSLLQSIFDGIPSQNKLFLDLENPLHEKIFDEKDYDRIFDVLMTIGIARASRPYLFLDEIQQAPQMPNIVKYLFDHYGVKCFLTGSASFYIKNLFTESLAGRKYLFELYPLTFQEFIRFKGNPITLPWHIASEEQFNIINRRYEEFLQWGGFPGVVLKESAQEKMRMLEDIFTSYFQMEVQRLGDFRKNDSVRDLMLLLMERIGSKIDVQKLAKEIGVSRHTCHEYLSFLEHTYFIKRIAPHSTNRDTEVRGAQKLYICDTGLARRFSRVSEGALFENTVFWQLQQKGSVNYYKKKSGAELDFIVNGADGYEVKLKADARDVKTAARIGKELSLKNVSVVSREYTPIQGVVFGSTLYA